MSKPVDDHTEQKRRRIVSDDKRFQKRPTLNGALGQVKNLVGEGLFTADLEDPAWGIAREYGHFPPEPRV